jgi:hypothetical protein
VNGCIIVEQLGEGTIYEVGDSKESLVLIFQGHRSMVKKGKTHLYNVALFMLGGTILLMHMVAQDLMRDVNISEKKRIKLLILPTPVKLNNNDLTIKHVLNMFLKLKEIFRNIRFMTE